MKYAVDQVTNNIALLENVENGNKIEVNISKLPGGIVDGDILVFRNETYELDIQTKNERLNVIKNKLENLKRNG